MEDSFLLGAVDGCSRVTPALRVSFWGWVEVLVVVVEEEVVVVAVVGGSSRGAGTGNEEASVGAGAAAGVGAGGWVPLARLPVRMLQRLSEELLRPDWLLTSLPRSCWSR